jgi:hypothetical protein
MADASLDTWAVAEPRSRAAGPLLDREIRRVGTARGDELVDLLAG